METIQTSNLLKNQKLKTTVMNFSGIYEHENFYKYSNANWIDLSSINGKTCICDNYAIKKIKSKIKNIPFNGLHYIDSGNYHYTTSLWISKIKEPFVLVVFDYHSDTQESQFKGMLTCGSWILRTLENNEFIKKVLVIGIGRDQTKSLSEKYRDKIECVQCDEIKEYEYILKDQSHSKYPVYISIDKDVLSNRVVNTNWSQGSMKLADLEYILHEIISNNKVLGIDICGECGTDQYTYEDVVHNDEVNFELLKCINDEI